MVQLTLSQALEGFLLEKRAQHLSPHTIADYTNAFRKLQHWLASAGRDADPPIAAITADQVRAFLAELGTVPQPMPGVAKREPRPLSKKTVLNIHTALSALWTWAVREDLADRHILRDIPRPRPEQRAIVPLTRAQIRDLLDACDRSRPYARPGKRTSDHGRPTALRDRAILLLLVDTGLRASELCGLRLHDVDVKAPRVKVLGKGSKERLLPLSPRTAKAIWKHLASDRPGATLGDPLFLSRDGYALTPSALLQLIRRLGDRAGVDHCHPHRFRHTFATEFLRNGGNVYALQAMLGHSTLEMVRRYLALVQTDIDQAHRTASPVSNWRL
jgi:site-specific recombinase XerD